MCARAWAPRPTGVRVCVWVDAVLPTRVVSAAGLALLVAAAAISMAALVGTLDDVGDLDGETELHANITFVEREGETGEPDGPAAIDVRSSNDSTILEVEVTYNVTGGSAGPDDHDGGEGTLVFNASGQVRTIELSLVDDDVHEGDETVTLTLSSDDPTVVFGTRNHTHAILDDDPANEPPRAPDAEVETEAGAAVSGTLPGSDPDGDALTWTVPIPPSHGTLEVRPGTGEYTYTPDPGFVGSDLFDYAVSDGDATRTGQVSVTVTSGDGSSDDPSTTLDGSDEGTTDGGTSDGDGADGDPTEGAEDGSTGAAGDDGDASGAEADEEAGRTAGSGTDGEAALRWLAGTAVAVVAVTGVMAYAYSRFLYGGL